MANSTRGTAVRARRTVGLGVAVLAGLAVLGGGSARAQAPRAPATLAAMLEPKIEGDLTKEEQLRLETAVTEGLRRAELDVSPPMEREAILSGEPELRGCRSEDCQERIGRLLGAQSVLTHTWQFQRIGAAPAAPEPAPAGVRPRRRGAVAAPTPAAPESKGNFTFSAALFNMSVGAIGVKEKTECKACSISDAEQKLTELVKQVVLLEAARPRGRVEVTSTPAADVLIDGRKVGFTPYKREAYVGKHELVVTRLGYKSEHQTLDVVEGKKAALSVTLKVGVDEVGPTPEELRRRRNRLITRVVVGVVGVGVGLGLVSVGAGALSVNGLPGLDAMGNERFDTKYNTLAPGGALIAVGSILTVGTILAVLPWEQFVQKKGKAKVKASAGLAPGGFGVALSGSF